MTNSTSTIIVTITYILLLCISIFLITLIIRVLLKYLKSKETIRQENVVQKSLGETIKAHRTRCKMTQEFVAEALGVSRQAVSKWENGTSDPSTNNLLALAKLFGVSAADLLNEVAN